MARFQVRETFAIQDQPTFVLAGFVVEGEVWPGMEVGILFNTKIRIKAKIDRVDFVRRPDGDVVCLCFDCSAPDEVTLWEALSVRNQTIEIRPATLPLTTYPK